MSTKVTVWSRSKYWLISNWVRLKDNTWGNLYKFGQNGLLRTSFLWIGIVPIAAKALDGVSHIHIGHARLSVALPFNWIVFYLAACCVAIATAIYWWYCPDLSREFKHYAQFENEKRSDEYLLGEFANEFERTPRKDQVHFLKRFCEFIKFQDSMGSVTPNRHFEHLITKLNNENQEEVLRDLDQLTTLFYSIVLFTRTAIIPRQEAFWFLHDTLNKSHPTARMCCSLFYGIGFALFIFVALQNFGFVLTKIF